MRSPSPRTRTGGSEAVSGRSRGGEAFFLSEERAEGDAGGHGMDGLSRSSRPMMPGSFQGPVLVRCTKFWSPKAGAPGPLAYPGLPIGSHPCSGRLSVPMKLRDIFAHSEAPGQPIRRAQAEAARQVQGHQRVVESEVEEDKSLKAASLWVRSSGRLFQDCTVEGASAHCPSGGPSGKRGGITSFAMINRSRKGNSRIAAATRCQPLSFNSTLRRSDSGIVARRPGARRSATQAESSSSSHLARRVGRNGSARGSVGYLRLIVACEPGPLPPSTCGRCPAASPYRE